MVFRGLACAVAACGVDAGLKRLGAARGAAPQWSRRRNYRGHTVSLRGGVAVVFGALGGVAAGGRADRRLHEAALLAGGMAAIAGVFDDLAGSGSARGFRGHVGALHRGDVTTGTVKLAAIGCAGLAAGWRLADGRAVRRLAAGAVVAASANLANLLDLRPGRALKAVLVVSTPVVLSRGHGAAVAAAVAGVAAGTMRDDLRERTMLGDGGANCLGALVGVALVAGASTRRVVTELAACVALTVASELVSFSRVIDRTPVLRWFDRLGRAAESNDA